MSEDEDKENVYRPFRTRDHQLSCEMHVDDTPKLVLEPAEQNKTPKTTRPRNVESKTIPSYKDFVIIKPISRGAFGKVFLGYKKNNPNKKYAIKVMKKADMIHKNLVHQVIAERNALALSKSPFVVRLYYSFQSEQHIYLVMEYMIGGDVKSLLAIYGFFDEAMAVFYTAEIALALKYLHSHGIVHRDLKPDNILISALGHIKLTDFGLSKVNLNRQICIHDLMNTPGINKEKSELDNDYFRTPGQILSLTSDFAFTVPHSRSRFDKRHPFESTCFSPAALRDEPSDNSSLFTPPAPIMKLEPVMKGLLQKNSQCRDGMAMSSLTRQKELPVPLVCTHPEATNDSSAFLTNSTPRSCSTISMGLQKSYAAQNLKSLRESCTNKCDENSNESNETKLSLDDGDIRQHHDSDISPDVSKSIHCSNNGRCRRRKRTFLSVAKSPYAQKLGTGLTSEFSMVALGDEHRLKRQNSSAEVSGTEAIGSFVSSQKLDFSHIDMDEPVKTASRSPADSSSLSDLEGSKLGSTTGVQLSVIDSHCDGKILLRHPDNQLVNELAESDCSKLDYQQELKRSEIQEYSYFEHSRQSEGFSLVQNSTGEGQDFTQLFKNGGSEPGCLSKRDNAELSENSKGGSLELSHQSKTGSLELSRSLSLSQKTSLDSSLRSMSIDDQLSVEGSESAVPSEVSTVFDDGRLSTANDADVSDMSMSIDNSSLSKFGSASCTSLGFTARHGQAICGQQSTDIVSAESISDSQLMVDTQEKAKDASRPLLPFKMMRFSSLPTCISATDTESSDVCNTPQRSQDCNSFKTPIMSTRCTPLRTPKSVRRGVPTKDRILGTPDYLAPELLLKAEHDSAVDWWALGVCLYEFLTGIPPFNDTTPEAVFQNILRRDLLWPEGDEALSLEAQHAIERLLDMDPKTRATINELQTMPLMKDVDWDNLLTTTPHFVPKPDNDSDTTYFEARNNLHDLTVSVVDMED